MNTCNNETYVLKDELLQNLNGIPKFSKGYVVTSERPNSEKDTAHIKFIRQYTSDLEKFLDEPICDRILLCVEELLTNMEDHGHKYDPTKATLIYTSIFDNGVLVSVQGEGPGYDVKAVRQECKNPDGSVYMGTRGRRMH